MEAELPDRADVVIVGAGHNGLVAAILLARANLDVLVLEAADVIGGAARTERPFPRVPGLRHSTGSYLLGLMPPELLERLDIRLDVGRAGQHATQVAAAAATAAVPAAEATTTPAGIRILRRDPHYFLPTPGGPGSPYLLFGTDTAATRAQLATHFSTVDLVAEDALQSELGALRDDLGPSWLAEPLPVEETAERYVRPALRSIFVDLVRGSVADYLARFEFESELLISMYAVTDGLSGLNAGPDDPGTGHNFLAHNMCRLPGSDGTWMITEGGMGSVSATFAQVARAAGARIATGTPVAAVTVASGTTRGVRLVDGREVAAEVVLGACDPYRLIDLVPDGALPATLTDRMAAVRRPGTTLKVNLALSGLPRFSCLPPGTPSPFGATIHLLPGSAALLAGADAGESPMAALRAMWADVVAGRLPAEPTIEWYLHTTVDPSLSDEAGHHSSALFVQSVPYAPTGTDWARALPGYVDRLLAICERYAPGTRDLVVDTVPLTPPGIEEHFGITGGHIHHVDNTVSYTDRMPYATGLDGLYAGSAGCYPGGSVIGAAGHNAAQRILTDLGR